MSENDDGEVRLDTLHVIAHEELLSPKKAERQRAAEAAESSKGFWGFGTKGKHQNRTGAYHALSDLWL
jgi:hypothetical protein